MPQRPPPPPTPPGAGGAPRSLRTATLALSSAGPLAQAALLAVAGLVLWGAWQVLQPTPEKRLIIATGPEQGAYDDFARRYRPLLQAHGVAVELRATQGSSDNLALLRQPGSGVHVAFVQGGALAAGAAPDAAAAADDEQPAVLSLGSVAVEPLWLFYREDSQRRLAPGKPPPEKLSQLAGWRINTGPPGGGTNKLFAQLAAVSGMPAAPQALDKRGAVDGVLELVQGRVDALAMVSAADAHWVRYLLATPGVQPMGLAQAEAYARRFSFLRALELPRGTVDLAADRPSQDLPLVATTATLAVRGDLHPALVQLLLQTAHQVHGQPGWFQRAGDYPQPSADELPLAPAAERYYRNGPPWLQHYLPFWLANFVDRMWIVLLPLLAALLPLSRILPPLVTLRLRSRVYRWYAHLRAIERELEVPGADLAALLTRLEALDTQTENIGLPLSFTNELYDLRGHIQLVRKRLLVRGAQAAPETPQPAES